MGIYEDFGKGKGGNEDTDRSTEGRAAGHMGICKALGEGRVEMKLKGVQQRVGRAIMHIRACRHMAVAVYIQLDGRSMFGYVYITA